MKNYIGTHHILLLTLDSLRFDVAQGCFEAGRLPNFSRLLPASGWELRETPANFTYAAHHAFFSGYLPTPKHQPTAPRLFASQFAGSCTTGPSTFVFQQPHLPAALAECQYETHCVGGVGFFNKQNELGKVLPNMFQHSYWSSDLSVTCPESAQHQFQLARDIVQRASSKLFLFINCSAIHQPNCFYLPGANSDNQETQAAALAYVDQTFAQLMSVMESTGPWFIIVTSDHGTAYGEEGLTGHRWNHPVINDVPYFDGVIEAK